MKEYFDQIEEEFYLNFENIDKEDIKSYLWSRSDKDRETILKAYNKYNKTLLKDNCNVLEVIFKIKCAFKKKSLEGVLRIKENEDINEYLKELSEEEKDTLLKEYYINTISFGKDISIEEKELNKKTIAKLKKLRNVQEKKYISFFDLFKHNTKEEVLRVILTLDSEDILLLQRKFGRDFMSQSCIQNISKDDNKNIYEVIREIRRKLKGLEEGSLAYMNIYDFVEGDLNILVKRLDKLSTENKEKIIKYLGKDLKSEVIVALSIKNNFMDERTRLVLMGLNVQYIIPLMNELESFKQREESNDQFRYRLTIIINTNLTKNERTVLNKIYGNSLDKSLINTNLVTDDILKINNNILLKIKYYLSLSHEKEKIERLDNITLIKYRIIKDITKSKEYKDLLRTMSEEEALSFILNKYLHIKDINSLTDEMVLKLSRRSK